MTAGLQFSPVLTQHAIERCAATIGFGPALPEKAFARVVEAVTPRLVEQGYQPQATASFGFEFGPQGVRQIEGTGAMPRLFVSPERSAQIYLAPDHISRTTGSYVRWQPFVGTIERLILPIVGLYRETVSINSVKLEYWDRFFWSGTWADFAVKSLIRKDSPYVVAAASSASKEWHCHVGWFSPNGAFRRLTNVNVDVAQIVPDTQPADPSLASRPSVGIYSTLLDQANVPGYGTSSEDELSEQFVVSRLEDQHLALKDVLGHIITDEMASRIGLFSRIPPNARP